MLGRFETEISSISSLSSSIYGRDRSVQREVYNQIILNNFDSEKD